MQSNRILIEIDAELVERAQQAGVPTGRSASTVVEEAVRVYLGTDVIDTVRARNKDVNPDEIEALGHSELQQLRRERQQARR